MANTLTGIIPTILEAMDQVSREIVGFIPSVYRNSSAARAAKDETITYPIVPAVAGEDIAPAATPKDSGDMVVGTGSMTISKSRAFPVRLTGEDDKGLSNSGVGGNVMRDRFAQAIRAAVNEIEADLAGMAYYASRAAGKAGTTPFASSFIDAATVNKILDDNGCPRDMRALVIDTSAALNMKGLSNYAQVSAAGGDAGLRRGVLLPLDGLDIRQSAQVKLHTKGTGTSYTIDNTGLIVAGSKLLKAKGGSGTMVLGDVLSIQSDDAKYLVSSGLSANGPFSIAAPGLLQDTADGKTITIGAGYRANLAFHRDAIHLVTRAPAMPSGGDGADDAYMLTDPITGLSFEVRVYRQYHQVKYEVCLAWGCAMVKPDWAAVLMG